MAQLAVEFLEVSVYKRTFQTSLSRLSESVSDLNQRRSQTYESGGGDKDADAEGVGYETPKASSGEMPKASMG